MQNTAARWRDEGAADPAPNARRCFSHNIVPTGNEVIQDPPVTTGLQVYQELFQSAVGMAGASGNFDGNGRYSARAGGGETIVADAASLPGNGPLYGNAVLPPLGTRPAYPGKAPPLRRDVACLRNAAPNLNNVEHGGRAVKRAIVIHRRDFVAIVALVVAAIAVVVYILGHQPSFTLGKSYYTVKAEFATGAAVTAGQGQAVDVAGVQVGQVGGVRCRAAARS